MQTTEEGLGAVGAVQAPGRQVRPLGAFVFLGDTSYPPRYHIT